MSSRVWPLGGYPYAKHMGMPATSLSFCDPDAGISICALSPQCQALGRVAKAVKKMSGQAFF